MYPLKQSSTNLTIVHGLSDSTNVNPLIRPHKPTRANQCLKVYTTEGYVFVKHEHIIYCKALGNYAEIFFYENDQPKSHVVSKSLKAIEAELPSDAFSRCHQSYLIPHDKIKCLTRHSSILLTTGTELPVSRRMKKRLLELL